MKAHATHHLSGAFRAAIMLLASGGVLLSQTEAPQDGMSAFAKTRAIQQYHPYISRQSSIVKD